MKKINKVLLVLFTLIILPQVYGFCQKRIYTNLRDASILDERQFDSLQKEIKGSFSISYFEQMKKDTTFVHFEITSGNEEIIKNIQRVDSALTGKEIKLQIADFINEGDYFKYDDTKPTILALWFIDCPPCIKEIPLLNTLNERHQNDVNFVALTYEDIDRLQDFLLDTEFDFLHARNVPLVQSLGDIFYPTTIFLDSDQKVKWIKGPINEEAINTFNSVLDNLFSGKPFKKHYNYSD